MRFSQFRDFAVTVICQFTADWFAVVWYIIESFIINPTFVQMAFNTTHQCVIVLQKIEDCFRQPYKQCCRIIYVKIPFDIFVILINIALLDIKLIGIELENFPQLFLIPYTMNQNCRFLLEEVFFVISQG